MKLNKTEYIKLYDEVGRLSDSITMQALKIRSLSNEIDKLTAELSSLKFYVLEGVYSLYDFSFGSNHCYVLILEHFLKKTLAFLKSKELQAKLA